MMSENEMGYRGSKSILKNIVKEQRVDGNWFLCKTARSLRCTLMGFERSYQIKILSKQLITQQNFSSLASAQVQNFNLNPWFVTGFSDAESSFSISIYLDKRSKKKKNLDRKTKFSNLFTF